MDTRKELLAEERDLLLQKKALVSGYNKARTSLTPKDLAQRFNKGLVDVITLPTNLINAGLRIPETLGNIVRDATGLPVVTPRSLQIPNTMEKQLAVRGYLPDPQDPAEGVAEHAMEFLGAGALPTLGMAQRGNQVLQLAVKDIQNLSIFDNLAVSTAAAPKATAVGEVVASFSAAAGGEGARQAEAPEEAVILAELLGGFTPAAVYGAISKFSILRFVGNAINKHLLPMTKPGAEPRAAERLQSKVTDAQAAAERIDVTSNISPARQTGDPELLALEKRVLDDHPEMREEFNNALNVAREELKQKALSFGGNVDRARELLRRGRDYLVELVNIRAIQASRDAELALSRLSSGATPREISQAVREAVDTGYKDARIAENALWNSLDSSAPVDLKNARQVLDGELIGRSKFDDPNDIPSWLKNALRPAEVSASDMAALKKAGLLESDGVIPPHLRKTLEEQSVIAEQSFTFNDARALRKRILQEIRNERAKDAPNRNKIRILNNIANGNEEARIKGLLDDLSDSGVDGVATARAFSSQLNQRFTQGRVGRLLGFDRSGGQSVSPEDTLGYLLSGRDPVTTIDQLIKASPDTAPMVQQYLKEEFLFSVVSESGVNKKAAEAFFRQWDKKGAFGVFPELRGQLENVRNINHGAEVLSARATKVRTFARSSGKSRAALYLEAEPGEEMRHVLNQKNPVPIARSLVRKMSGDAEAINGLKTSFIEDGFRRSTLQGQFHADGSPIIDGRKFTQFLSDYKTTAKALKISDTEMRRLERIALSLRQVQTKPGKIPKSIIEDTPTFLLDLFARYIGAQSGGRMASSMGSGLVMAQAMSQRTRLLLTKITRNRAQELLVDAHSDPALYRALLLRPDSPEPTVSRANATIKAWLVGVGVDITELTDETRATEGPL